MSAMKNKGIRAGDLDTGRIPGDGQGLPRREFKYGQRKDLYRCYECGTEYHAPMDDVARCPKCGCGRYTLVR